MHKNKIKSNTFQSDTKHAQYGSVAGHAPLPLYIACTYIYMCGTLCHT